MVNAIRGDSALIGGTVETTMVKMLKSEDAFDLECRIDDTSGASTKKNE